MLVEILFITDFVLLVLEAFNPTKGILAIVGFIAYVAGVWTLIENGESDFYGVSITNVIILGLVFAAALVIFIVYLKRAMNKAAETGTEYFIGHTATVTQWKNGKGKVFIDGEDWRAIGPKDLHKDDTVIVTAYENLTLTIEKEKEA